MGKQRIASLKQRAILRFDSVGSTATPESVFSRSSSGLCKRKRHQRGARWENAQAKLLGAFIAERHGAEA